MVNGASDQDQSGSAFLTIAVAGLIAGSLDITGAFLAYTRSGAQVIRLLQGIAAGLIGVAAARAGGIGTALLGLGCHYCIATMWAATYYAASRRLTVLVERPIMSGALFGLVVYAVMNHVVVPLSAIGPRPFVLSGALLAAGILVVCIGIPIALVVSRLRAGR